MIEEVGGWEGEGKVMGRWWVIGGCVCVCVAAAWWGGVFARCPEAAHLIEEVGGCEGEGKVKGR